MVDALLAVWIYHRSERSTDTKPKLVFCNFRQLFQWHNNETRKTKRRTIPTHKLVLLDDFGLAVIVVRRDLSTCGCGFACLLMCDFTRFVGR